MSRTRKDPESLLPLSPPVFHILLALGVGRRHPYAIMQEIRARSGGKAIVLPGTLYSSIARMLEQGLIQETLNRPQPDRDDPRRRYYRVTPFGKAVAEAEAGRMQVLLKLAKEQRLCPE